MTEEIKDNSESSAPRYNNSKKYRAFKTKKDAFLHCEWEQLTKYNKPTQILTIALHQQLVDSQGMTHDQCLTKTQNVFQREIAKTSILSTDSYPFINKNKNKDKFKTITISSPSIVKRIVSIALN
eukprot:100764_1